MKKGLNFVEKITALAAVFFLPSQLALHFWPESAFVFGIRVDYLSPSIYFTDILIIGLLFIFIINEGHLLLNFISKNIIYFITLFVLLILNTYFSSLPFATFYKWSKILEYIFFGLYIYIRKDFLGQKNMLKVFVVSTIAISLLAITQFLLQRTTDFMWIFGERTFSKNTPGIALVQINGSNFLRSYSILPHPNSLAGYLGISMILLFFSISLKKRNLWFLYLLPIFSAFVLTFSITAFIAIVVVLIAFALLKNKYFKDYLLKYLIFFCVLFSLVLPVFSERIINTFIPSQNIRERIELSYISGKMSTENVWLGEGVNTFIINSVRYKRHDTYLWLLQPVHNIFLLTLSESGMFGLLFLMSYLYKSIFLSISRKSFVLTLVCVFLLVTGLSDHYWVTIQQNFLLLAFVFGLTSKPFKDLAV